MDTLSKQSFFIISSDDIDRVKSNLYGYCVANDDSHLFKKDKKLEENLLEVNLGKIANDGCYVLVQNLDKEIIISQDFTGSFGLYLYKTDNFFAISNSFLLLAEYLSDKFELNLDFNYINSYLLSDLTALSYSETMIKEIIYLPKDIYVIINKSSKDIYIKEKDYKNNSVSIDSQEAMDILDAWYIKWINVLKYISKNFNNISVDLSGGMDSRLVFLFFIKSGINLDKVKINSATDGLHTHKEDYEIASQIAKFFDFKLNNQSQNITSIPLSLEESINIISYGRLGFVTEIYPKLSFYKDKLFKFSGYGGEALRKHWDMIPDDYIESIANRTNRYLNIDISNDVRKILSHAMSISKTKYNIDNPSSSAIIDGFYRETRCRNHFGREMANNSICNVFIMTPLLDSALTKICLDNSKTKNRDIIIATIFLRYCPELLNFKFDSNRKIDEEIIKYAKELNNKYPFKISENQITTDGEWILFSNLEYNNSKKLPVNIKMINSFFLRSFLSKQSYKLFTNSFHKEIYLDAFYYSQRRLYHPEARYIPILGIVKIINEIQEKKSETPYNFFNSLLEFPQINLEKPYEEILSTARIDIKNYNQELENSNIDISIDSSYNYAIDNPEWFNKNGVGYIIRSKENSIDLKITALNSGKLNISLKTQDIREKEDKNKRINYLLNYKKFIINNEIVFDYIIPCSHDTPFYYQYEIKAGEKITIHLEWEPYNYGLLEYVQLIPKIISTFISEPLPNYVSKETITLKEDLITLKNKMLATETELNNIIKRLFF